MNFIICSTILPLVAGTAIESEVAKAFRGNFYVKAIVPDPPDKLISVKYSSVDISCPGIRVQPFETLKEPTQVSYEASDSELYTLMFIGPDVPPSIVGPPYTQFIHWLVVNIPGQDVGSGKTIAKYFSPIPYPLQFPYIFLLYKQKGSLDTSRIPDLSFILSRLHFSPDQFALEHNLGSPIAGNFIRETYGEIINQILQPIINKLP